MKKKKVINKMTTEWHAEKINNEFVFYKHIIGTKRSAMYQVILSGDISDGLYQLNTGRKFRWEEDDDVITINAKGNLDCALFKTGDGVPRGYVNPEYISNLGYSIIRMDYESEELFIEALLDTGLITEEEYYRYTYKESQGYIYSKTPKIKFAV